MNFKKIIGLVVTTLALNIIILGDVNAASVTAKCTVKANRSKISVDADGLGNGSYRASARSGTSAAVYSKNLKTPVGDEVEFDFDSNTADIKAGATAIPVNFIKGNRVVGNIYKRNSTGTLSLVGSVGATCK